MIQAKNNLDFDAALLTLDARIDLPKIAEPIKLPEDDDEPLEGELTIVSGWGTQSLNSLRAPEKLRAVNVSIVNREKCKKAYEKEREVVTKQMICAGVPGGGEL